MAKYTLNSEALCAELKKQEAGLLQQISEMQSAAANDSVPVLGQGEATGIAGWVAADLETELRFVQMQIDENCGGGHTAVGSSSELLYPAQPIITYPNHAKFENYDFVSLQPTFTWYDGAQGEQNAATSFGLRLSSGPSPAGPWVPVLEPVTLTATSYQYEGLLEEETWHLLEVDAYNAVGDSGWSSVSFYTFISIPLVPLVTQPQEGQIYSPTEQFEATWTDPGRQTKHAATSFEYQLILDPPAAPLQMTADYGGYLVLIAITAPNSSYQFRIRSQNAAGSSDFATVQFKTAAS